MKLLILTLMSVGMFVSTAQAGGQTAREWQCRELLSSDEGHHRMQARHMGCTERGVRNPSVTNRTKNKIFQRTLRTVTRPSRRGTAGLTHEQRVRRIFCQELMSSDDGGDRFRARQMGCGRR